MRFFLLRLYNCVSGEVYQTAHKSKNILVKVTFTQLLLPAPFLLGISVVLVSSRVCALCVSQPLVPVTYSLILLQEDPHISTDAWKKVFGRRCTRCVCVCVCVCLLCADVVFLNLTSSPCESVFFSDLIAIAQVCVDANCPEYYICRHAYFPSTRRLWETCRNLTEVPIGIRSEALRVYLSCNSISSLPAGIFSNLTQCTRIDLEYNQISFVHKEAFKGITSLEELYLHQNRISTIEPGTFDELKALKLLHLWGNQLSSIEAGMFRNLHTLEKLLLNHNQIYHIEDGAFDSLFSLKILDLSNNRLANLKPNILINLPRSPLQLGFIDHHPFRQINMWNCLSMCWLKHEEQLGTIRWWDSQGEHFPVCAAGGDWYQLQCPEPGEWIYQNNCEVS